MEIKIENIESIIYKKLKTNQILLAISVIISISVVIWRLDYVYWALYFAFIGALYFAFIGALNLPNINKCKQDLFDYKRNNIISTKGLVVDFFPEKEGTTNNWVLFLNHDGNIKNIKEFVLPEIPNLKTESSLEIYHTRLLEVPVKVVLEENNSLEKRNDNILDKNDEKNEIPQNIIQKKKFFFDYLKSKKKEVNKTTSMLADNKTEKLVESEVDIKIDAEILSNTNTNTDTESNIININDFRKNENLVVVYREGNEDLSPLDKFKKDKNNERIIEELKAELKEELIKELKLEQEKE